MGRVCSHAHRYKKDEQLSLLVFKTLCHTLADYRTIVEDLYKIVEFVEASSILVVYLFNSSSQSVIEGDDALYLIEAVLGNGLLCTE